MIISDQDAEWAANEFIQYFSHMGNIEDYLRFVKREVIKTYRHPSRRESVLRRRRCRGASRRFGL